MNRARTGWMWPGLLVGLVAVACGGGADGVGGDVSPADFRLVTDEEAIRLAEVTFDDEPVREYLAAVRALESGDAFTTQLTDLELVAYGYELVLRAQRGETFDEILPFEAQRLAALGFDSPLNEEMVFELLEQHVLALRQATLTPEGDWACSERMFAHGTPYPAFEGYLTPEEAVANSEVSSRGTPQLATESGDTSTWVILDEFGLIRASVYVSRLPSGGYAALEYEACA